jgi:ribosomal-protein-alanine N-acetyltransferase
MPIVIEAMQESDLDDVMRIEQASFKLPWQRSFFVADLNHPYAWLIKARDEGRLLGYAVAWRTEDEFHLANIAVDIDARRQGVGTMLLNRLLEIGHELSCTGMYLEVRPSNLAARSFYGKHGFFSTYIRKAYYPDQEDALVLERELPIRHEA